MNFSDEIARRGFTQVKNAKAGAAGLRRASLRAHGLTRIRCRAVRADAARTRAGHPAAGDSTLGFQFPFPAGAGRRHSSWCQPAEAYEQQTLQEAQQRLAPGATLTPADFRLSPEQHAQLKQSYKVPSLRPAVKAWRVSTGRLAVPRPGLRP